MASEIDITAEERAYAAAVHQALTGNGKFPPGHEFAGLTKQEVIDRENERRQNPPEPDTAKLPPVAKVQVRNVVSEKKDAVASSE